MSRSSAAFPVVLTICLLGGQWLPEAQSPRRGTPAGIPPEVLSQASTRGSVRVIVRLDVPFSTEAMLDAAQAASQRASIATAQATVLGRLARANAARVRQFAYIPYLALEVDEAGLQTLASLPEVTDIRIDRLAAPTLTESRSLIGAYQTWLDGYRGQGWAIGVLDTGVDKTHPFLRAKVISEACYSTTVEGFSTSVCPGGAGSSTAPESGVPCAMSGCEHGTHVAGIAAGHEGVATDASLIAIQVFSSISTECGEPPPCARSFESDLIAGLERVYALRNTYQIASVNLSLGGGLFTSPCDGDPPKAIIDQLRGAGIATVIASGNEGSATALSAPACISTAISVGSTTDGSSGVPADRVSSFTNSNQYLTLLAPGETITSATPGGGFASFNGTSMAAPHVAGAWAVMKGRSPTATVTEIANVLVGTGLGVFDSRNGLTKPRIRLFAAVQALPPRCTYMVTPTSVSMPRAGGTVAITLTTSEADCPWGLSNQAYFVSVPSENGYPLQSGTGSRTIVLSVAANPFAPRNGVVLWAGIAVTIQQTGGTHGDIDGDGFADLLWQHATNGSLATWYLEGHNVVATYRLSIDRVTDLNWRVAGSGDLNGDGFSDLVWQHQIQGWLAVWYLSGTQVIGTHWLSLSPVGDTDWQIRGVGDTNGDGFADLIWQHRTQGWLAVWYMTGAEVVGTHYLSIPQVADTNWQIAAAGDINADGKADIIWENDAEGGLGAWLMDGNQVGIQRQLSIAGVSDLNWKVRGAGDANGDGYADLLWQNMANGDLGVWYLTDFNVIGTAKLPLGVGGSDWRLVGPG